MSLSKTDVDHNLYIHKIFMCQCIYTYRDFGFACSTICRYTAFSWSNKIKSKKNLLLVFSFIWLKRFHDIEQMFCVSLSHCRVHSCQTIDNNITVLKSSKEYYSMYHFLFIRWEKKNRVSMCNFLISSVSWVWAEIVPSFTF